MSEPKYIKVNGVLKINPKYQDASTSAPSTLPAGALLPVTSLADVARQNESGSQIVLSDSTMSSVEIIQDQDVTRRFRSGTTDPGILDGLSRIFQQYEIAIGLINKLLELMFCHVVMYLDDSSSMNTADGVTTKGVPCRRWEEMWDRLHVVGEILSYIPCLSVTIRFLNRPVEIKLLHSQHTPASFYQAFKDQIDEQFRKAPSGSTPLVSAMQRSLADAARSPNDKVSLYFFTDGEPDGRQFDIIQIENMLKTRDVKRIPVMFISCSGDDSTVAWMKDLEERVEGVGEVDDFVTESQEVLNDQTNMFPYSKGFWLICQLVGAINKDLDSLDESIPLTKATFDDLMGRVLSAEEYRGYYQLFLNNPKQTADSRATLQRYFGNTMAQFETFVGDRDGIDAVRRYSIEVLKKDPRLFGAIGAVGAIGAGAPPVQPQPASFYGPGQSQVPSYPPQVPYYGPSQVPPPYTPRA